MTQQFLQLVGNPVFWILIFAYWIFSAAASALPAPDSTSGKGYQFFFQFMRIFAGQVKNAFGKYIPDESTSAVKTQAGFGRMGAILMLAVVSMVVLLSGCPKGAVHQASQLANAVGGSLEKAQKLNESLYTQKVISAEDSMAVAQAILETSQANDALVAQVRSVKELNLDSAAPILTALDNLTASVDRLQKQGVLHIKSESSRQTFDSYMQVIRAAIKSAQAIIATNIKTTTAHVMRARFVFAT